MAVNKQNEEPNQDFPIDGFDIQFTKEKLARIDRLVDDYEKLISHHIDQVYTEETRWSDKLADRIALFGGSWKFIVSFFIFLIIWIGWNLWPLVSNYHFDPEPFILLNLLLSLLAAFQAPIIMMSQNRQVARDKRESIIDFAINYKSEYEIDDIQTKLQTISAQLKKIDKQLLYLENLQRECLNKSPGKKNSKIKKSNKKAPA